MSRFLSFKEARDRALAAGASPERVEQYRASYFGSKQVKQAMILALHLSPWRNSADDWARLAGARGQKGK